MLGTHATAVEKPKFVTVVQNAKFEVRKCAAFIVAQTWVEGDKNAACDKGLRLFAGYLFGNNKVALRWRVHFVMPSQHTMATLPKPNTSLVTLRALPDRPVVNTLPAAFFMA